MKNRRIFHLALYLLLTKGFNVIIYMGGIKTDVVELLLSREG